MRIRDLRKSKDPMEVRVYNLLVRNIYRPLAWEVEDIMCKRKGVRENAPYHWRYSAAVEELKCLSDAFEDTPLHCVSAYISDKEFLSWPYGGKKTLAKFRELAEK